MVLKTQNSTHYSDNTQGVPFCRTPRTLSLHHSLVFPRCKGLFNHWCCFLQTLLYLTHAPLSVVLFTGALLLQIGILKNPPARGTAVLARCMHRDLAGWFLTEAFDWCLVSFIFSVNNFKAKINNVGCTIVLHIKIRGIERLILI